MPHSSGGGGGHSGSHHSHYSGSSSSGQSVRISSSYFTGSNVFMYYRNGIPNYVYTDSPTYTLMTNKVKGTFYIVFASLILFFSVIILCASAVTVKKPVTIDYDTSTIVFDYTNTLSEEDINKLYSAFKTISDKTGITPAFILTDTLDGDSSLQIYAYNAYVRNFDDEKHWLVAVEKTGDGERDFEWEGMIGDACGTLVTAADENDFTDYMHKCLIKTYPDRLADGIITGFYHINDFNTGIKINYSVVVVCGLISILCIILIIHGVRIAKKPDDFTQPVRIPKNLQNEEHKATEVNCEYCGGLIVYGLHTKCPHCNAPILAREF